MWKKVFEGKIPKDKYEMLLQNGEKQGLIITLISSQYNIEMDFGAVSAVRMLDEGIVLDNLFEEKQMEEFRKHEFDEFIRKIGGELYDCLRLKHYIIISLNYVVEIIAGFEPNINIIKKQ